MKIELEVSEKNESTAEPWWVIVDAKQNFEIGVRGATNIMMSMITGPFFSREEAERVLKERSHHYSNKAVVWCDSGCYTHQYREAYRAAEEKKKVQKQSEGAREGSREDPRHLRGDMVPPHLRDDTFTLRCSGCGRKAFTWQLGEICRMPQPSGETCFGVFEKGGE